MDQTDRDLLNMIQTGFPIADRPYDEVAGRLGITPEEALSRTRALAQSGIIRRIGPSFDSYRLGHVSALVAARVPQELLEETALLVSSYPEVTHNYGRDHDYNLWFAVVAGSQDRLSSIVESIKCRSGISDIHVLPAERTFKIRVDFEF